MADTKISALTSATTPLAGTEEVPLVQSATTKKVTVANLTAGRDVSCAGLTTTGNVTLGDASTDTVQVNGTMGVGGANPYPSNYKAWVGGQNTNANTYGLASEPTISVAGVVSAFASIPTTSASAITVTDARGFYAVNATKGAGSTITNQHGVYIADLTQGTNNYGITSLVSSGSNKWNIYASGTAANYFAGNVGIGTTSPSGYSASYRQLIIDGGANPSMLQLNNTTTGAGVNTGGFALVQSGVNAFLINPQPTGYLAAFTNNTERLRIDSSGNLLITSTGGLGYGTGSGGAVTQITSRTTGVTLNKTNGAITLVSAAGSASWQSFTVTNSTVAATDVVKVCQKSGTDLYMIHVTAVAAGSFRISFATTGGTTTEQPVFNFAVIKAVTA